MSVFSTGIPTGALPIGANPAQLTQVTQSVQAMSRQVRDLQTEIREARNKKASGNDSDNATMVFSPTSKSTSAAGGLRGNSFSA